MTLSVLRVDHLKCTVTTFGVFDHPEIAHLAIYQFEDRQTCVVVPTSSDHTRYRPRDIYCGDPHEAAEEVPRSRGQGVVSPLLLVLSLGRCSHRVGPHLRVGRFAGVRT